MERRRDAGATRRRVLDAAEQAFAAHGFQGARMRDMAKAAGVHPPLIHHYFVDKEGLFRAVLERALGESTAETWRILERDDGVAPMIERFATMLLAFNQRHQNLATILRFEANSGSAVSALTTEVLRVALGPVVAAVKRLVRGWQERSLIRAELDPSDLILTGLALCSYPFADRGFLAACMPEALVEGERRFDERRGMIVEVLLRYCAPLPATPQS